MKNIYKLIVCFLMVVVAINASAQKSFTTKKRYWSVGGSLNTMNYVGDLDPGQSFLSPNLALTRYNFGVCVLYRYSSRVSFRGAFAFGRIEGDDSWSRNAGADAFRKVRNANFVNNIVELKFDGVIDLFESRGKIEKRPLFNPYLFAGVAGFYHNPLQRMADNSYKSILEYNPEKASGYQISKFQIAIPFGIGFRYKIARQWDLAFEIGWRKTFTGYLDGLNGRYQDNVGRDRSEINGVSYQMQETASLGWIKYDDNGITGTIKDDAPQIAKDRFVQGYVDANGNAVQAHITGFSGWSRDENGELYFRNGNKPSSDWYIVSGFHLTYIIQSGIRCPKFR